VNLDLVHEVISRGLTKTTVRLPIGIKADLRVVDDEEFPTTVAHFTGSKEHNIQMRRLARERGWKISEYGVFEGDQKHSIRDEHDFYDLFGLDFIPPELREGQGEIEAAESGTLPRLVDESDLVGVLHAHTTWSDGRQSIEEMALAARDLGYRYLGITDHSQVAGYAGGLDPDRLQRQREEIEALREKELGIDILAGSEVDILADGGLDFSDSVLEELDFVIASIHSGFGQSREVMTDRICSALYHPRVDILAHPTGRLLLTREPYAVDLERVMEVALETGTVLEINANPHRLDLDAVWARRAKEMGISLLLGPDAHHVGGFAVMRYGLATARRAWLTAEDVINSLSSEALRKRLKGGKG
jgi:DNA polymerase (family 10)